MNYTQRFYEGETDYTAMRRRLIADSYKLAAPHSYMLLGTSTGGALLPVPAASCRPSPSGLPVTPSSAFSGRAQAAARSFRTRTMAPQNLTCWPTLSKAPAHTCHRNGAGRADPRKLGK